MGSKHAGLKGLRFGGVEGANSFRPSTQNLPSDPNPSNPELFYQLLEEVST